jgi:hypothetical protein
MSQDIMHTLRRILVNSFGREQHSWKDIKDPFMASSIEEHLPGLVALETLAI